MTFEEAWSTLEIGDTCTVSDGTPQPTNVMGMPYRAWRSHNFTGVLIERTSTVQGRGMTFELPPALAFVLAFNVLEAVPHTFTI